MARAMEDIEINYELVVSGPNRACLFRCTIRQAESITIQVRGRACAIREICYLRVYEHGSSKKQHTITKITDNVI